MQFIDLSKQQKLIKKKIHKRIMDVLSHSQYIMGKEVYELEERLAEYVKMKHCVTCSSGTDALLIALMAHQIGPGDAVLTSPFTFVSSAEAISLVGATPVFVDIYNSTYNIDPDKIKESISNAKSKNLKPKAIIPIDIFGLPARYRKIMKIAEENNLIVIEDFAQGFGGKIRDSMAGSFGHVSATSFFPSKPLGCYGDGGALFTNDHKIAEKIKSIRIHGSGISQYENVRVGINGRLDTIQAAILIEKLAIFDNELKLRNNVASLYLEKINSNYVLPYIPKEYSSSWAQFSLLAENSEHRSTIKKHLDVNKIPSMIYYPIPLHLQKVYDDLGYKKGSFVNSENISERIFSIPMHPYLNLNDQNKIIEKLNEI